MELLPVAKLPKELGDFSLVFEATEFKSPFGRVLPLAMGNNVSWEIPEMLAHKITSLAATALLLSACGGSGGASGVPNPPPAPPRPVVEKTFDFAQGSGGWLSGYADYSPSTAPNDVVSEIRALPVPFSGFGYYNAGTNRSDDLFIYVKTKIGGLAAGTNYRVGATVEFLTDVPVGCSGVGGAPGESVWVVVATSSSEPQTQFNGLEYRMNIERGNQSQSGRDGVVVGNIANTVQDCGPRRWETKSLATPIPSPLIIRADDRGEAWFLVGIDSGFESFSRVYYQRFIARFEPV
jgi:hypothetical protein